MTIEVRQVGIPINYRVREAIQRTIFTHSNSQHSNIGKTQKTEKKRG